MSLTNAPDPRSGPGPWFAAGLDGACSRCGGEIEPGDRIRADGWGSYECCDTDEEPDPARFQSTPVANGLSTPGDLYDYDGEG